MFLHVLVELFQHHFDRVEGALRLAVCVFIAFGSLRHLLPFPALQHLFGESQLISSFLSFFFYISHVVGVAVFPQHDSVTGHFPGLLLQQVLLDRGGDEVELGLQFWICAMVLLF